METVKRPEDQENPTTAIVSESETEPTTPTHRHKTKKKKRKRWRPNYDIPGVFKIVLPELTQKVIGCVVGDNVTSEKPWINVEKEVITDHLDTHAESSEFLPIKTEILECPLNELLIGYIPDESKDYDEFYICVTEEATENIHNVVGKVQRIQEERLKNAIHKKIKKWKGLGSEVEVEEAMVKYHRSLIEVEIESKYPILPFKVQFRLVKTEDLRDGYMELRSTDESSNTIFRKRVDAFVQVAPSVLTNEAQTICTYPKNSYTQYDYEVPQVDWEESIMKEFVSESMDSFCDILRVNGCIDLYSNDYEKLVLDSKFASKVELPEPKDYYCFIDMNLCGNKMISGTSWHQMWSGCVLLSYVDIAPSLYLTSKLSTDEVFKAVHDTNPVLFWSFTDDLKPKLILETPRPVYTVSCCPFDPNLIVGGCANGQIILWDITNKLHHVEEEEILTINQQKYREYMFSLMNWMKNIFDLALVRPTALSDLKYSHKGCVNYITWLSPFHTVSKTGKIAEIEEGKPQSLELVTSAEDGTIMIWDLLRKPTTTPGGFKAVRKMKRLKKRPSALLTMESPFKILHLNLKPVYKINVINPTENNRLMGIACSYMSFFRTLYEPVTKESRKNIKLSDRLFYKPVLNIQNSNQRKTFYVGTMEGEFLQGTWDGQAFDSGEVVNFEDAAYVNSGKYHDGPIVCIDYSPKLDTILTVGGKIFALWREPFKNRPVLWRKSSSIYTYGSWFVVEEASIKLARIDGYHEAWTLFYQSKNPMTVRLMSNGAINNISVHPRKLRSKVIALSDYRGSLRLFFYKPDSPMVIKAKEENMSLFLTREIARKKAFLKWQSDWNERRRAPSEVVEKEEKPVIVDEEQGTRKKEEKKKTTSKISPGMRYMEAMQEQQKANEQARIKRIILMKKQLDTEDLLKKREPLRKLEEENEIKKRKQKMKLKQSDKIFKEQVAMFFPDVVKEKPPPPPDPYVDCYSEAKKKVNFDDYYEIAVASQDYVEAHPFSYDFSWTTVLKAGRERRKKLDDSPDKDKHRLRYASYREEKVKALVAEEASQVEEKQSAVEDEISISTTMSKNTVVMG
ncbi:dynein axonemal intermediate chain 3 [Zophobas morio]|uniref:dynein axonemal intermediate chain 3 n=1 Tax=Zophobas morio TaxID=2755281 RepID=UPI00308390A0